jgi:hypothetical protein
MKISQTLVDAEISKINGALTKANTTESVNEQIDQTLVAVEAQAKIIKHLLGVIGDKEF